MVCYEWGPIVLRCEGKEIMIDRALFFQDCPTLISVSQLTDMNFAVLLLKNQINIYKSVKDIFLDKPFMTSDKRLSEKLWTLQLQKFGPYHDNAKCQSKFKTYMASFEHFDNASATLLHTRFGHSHLASLRKLFPHLINVEKLPPCDGCFAEMPNKRYVKDYVSKDTVRISPFASTTEGGDTQQKDTVFAVTDSRQFNSKEEQISDYWDDDVNVKLLIEELSNSIAAPVTIETCYMSSVAKEDQFFGRHLHSDTKSCSTQSCRGYNYLFIVVDQDTRVTYGFLGASKSDFTPLMKRWLRKFNNKYKRFPTIWRFDSGGEFLNHELLNFLWKGGVEVEYSTTKQSNQNSFAERKIGVIWRIVRILLSFSGLPMQFWCYCAMYVIFIQNHLPHRGLNFDIPFNVAKLPLKFKYIWTWGCEVWFSDTNATNHHSHNLRGVFLGVSDLKMGYDILNIATGKVIQSRNVTFFEKRMPFRDSMQPCKINLDFGTWPTTRKPEKVSIPAVVVDGGEMDSQPPMVEQLSSDNMSIMVPQTTPVPLTTQSVSVPTESDSVPTEVADVEPIVTNNPTNGVPNNLENSDIVSDNVEATDNPLAASDNLNDVDNPVAIDVSPDNVEHFGPKTYDDGKTSIREILSPVPRHTDTSKMSPITVVNDTQGSPWSPNDNGRKVYTPGLSPDSLQPEISPKVPTFPSHLFDEDKHPDVSSEAPLTKLNVNLGNKPSSKTSKASNPTKSKRGRGRPKKVVVDLHDEPEYTTSRDVTDSQVDNIEEHWEVKEVLDMKFDGDLTKRQYEILWGDGSRTWIPAVNTKQYAQQAVKDFKLKNPEFLTRAKERFHASKPAKSKKGKGKGVNLSNSRKQDVDRQCANFASMRPYLGDTPYGRNQDYLVFHNEYKSICPKVITDGDIILYQSSQKARNTYESEFFNVPEHPNLTEVIHKAYPAIMKFLEDDTLWNAPLSRAEMLNLPPEIRKFFLDAENVELTGIKDHGTFQTVDLPEGRVPITCRWVYDIKRNKNGSIKTFKARLVVQGFKQREGIDFSKTFSSTTQLRTFRLAVAVGLELDLNMTQYDISNAFLNGKLEEDIYMTWPPGYPSKQKGKVIKLIKGLYGLKQASRLWQQTLYDTLTSPELGLEVCKTESGVLHTKTTTGEVVLLLCFVDDLVLFCNDKALEKKIVRCLGSNFILKCLGELEHYVGVVVEHDKKNGEIDMHQSPYNSKVWKSYLEESAPTSTIPASTVRLSSHDCPETPEQKAEVDYPYINATGSLLYSALCTRPDIFFATMQLARFNSNPGLPHVKASKQVLRYLKGTNDLGIKFTKSKPPADGSKPKIKITAFVDSDWAGCIDTRRSTMGYVIHVANGPVSWKSKLMKTLALSSCEAEFMALTEVCRELMWMCRFFDEVGIDYEVPEIYCDSSSAINWSSDPVQHQRNKHVELKYYYCRDICNQGKVQLFKINTVYNCADIMTKPAGRQILERLGPVAMGHKKPVLSV